MKQLPCKSSEGGAEGGYILTMEDAAEDSRVEEERGRLTHLFDLDKNITPVIGVELLPVVHGDGGCGAVTQSRNVREA